MDKHTFYKEYRHIVMPLMAQAFVTTFVAMIDNLMVGQLGDNAIAAVAISNRILGMIMFTIFGISGATGVFIAQYFGAKNVEKQRETFRISILMSVAIFLVASVLFMVMPQAIIQFFIQDSETENLALQYISVMLIGYIPYVININYITATKVVGQVKLSLIASLIGVVVNTTGNYLLIFGNFGLPAMGVRGAALATVLARIVEFAIVYSVVLYDKYEFNTKWKDIFQISPDLFKEVVNKALPLAVNEIIWSFGQATILKIYGVRGSEVIAAYAINDTTLHIFHSFSQGISAATPVLVSQRLGANQLDEAYWNAKMMLKVAMGVAVFLGICMFGMSYIIPNLYQVSPASHDLSVQMIRLSSCLFWIYIINVQTYFIMRAGGDMKSTLIMDGVFYWCVTIPALVIATYFTALPILWVFVVGQCTELIKMCLSLNFFFKKRWVRNLTTQ